MHNRKISVVGLGYVGLPVACSFAASGIKVIGFDINEARIAELKSGVDRTDEVECGDLESPFLTFTTNASDLGESDFHIVTVPTPITEDYKPDLGPLISASRTVGSILKKGDIVVYESTVYPGVTEEECIPLLESESGLSFGVDFTVGYSPERINPGDKSHRLESIVKVVSGSDPVTLSIVASVYSSVVKAGIHRAPSIRVAEAAKVIENTQRDLNIALMNELSFIFDRIGIRTKDVLEAAGTKWNFLPFTPGLVGGHCIGVDPYYLTSKAESLGYNPQVILSGRRINDSVGVFVGNKLVELLRTRGSDIRSAKVGVLGMAFKENVPDLRNSRVPDILAVLRSHGIEAIIHDPLADHAEVELEYGVKLSALDSFANLDGLILAVPHKAYLDSALSLPVRQLKRDGIFVDLKSVMDPGELPPELLYWSL